jgi:hypothetical protein
MMSNPNPFSGDSIDQHIAKADAQENSANVGAELAPGERRPSMTFDAQGTRKGKTADLTWGAWVKTKFSKATTAAGASLGFKWALLGLAFLAAQAAAQTPMPPPASYYEIGIFRTAVSLATPFTTTRILPEMLTCGRLKREEAPDNTPNPTTFAWSDPNDLTKDCVVEAPTVAIALPIGVQYKAAVRAVSDVGGVLNPSAWSFQQFTFRRAPRGRPCPNGEPGVLVRGEADLNGKPVQISLCVNQ